MTNAWLVCFLTFITHFKQYCHVGHTAQQCRLGLFQNSFLEIFCCPKLDVQETNFCSTESEIISRLNPAKDCGADRVFSSFVVCEGVCLQGFVPGHGPTTLTRLQKCAQYIYFKVQTFAADQGSVCRSCRDADDGPRGDKHAQDLCPGKCRGNQICPAGANF